MPLFQNLSVSFFEKKASRSNGILVRGRFFDSGRGMLQSANKGTVGKLGFERNNWMEYHVLRAKSVSGTHKASSRGYCRCVKEDWMRKMRPGAHLPFAPNQACI
jgi:hypothetical protein